MQEHSFLSDLSDNDVVAFEENNLNKLKTLRNILVECFKSHRIYQYLNNQGLQIPQEIKIIDQDKNSKTYYNSWLGEGVKCEVLKLGANDWQSGKIHIRVNVEFIPDEPEIQEPESPLDDIRQAMSQVE